MPPVQMVTFLLGTPDDPQSAFSVPYNPTELSFEKAMQFAEITIPGLNSPLQQFVRGNAEKLTMELFCDSTDKGTGLGATSVTSQTDQIFALARIDPDKHAPPLVSVFWSSHFPGDSLPANLTSQRRNSFTGVVESIRQRFTLFSPEGIPLRATINLVIREYQKLDDQLTNLKLKSTDRTHSHTVKGGDTLTALAAEEWNQPGQWRHIADANELEDPRRLKVGTFLSIPAITTR